MFMCRWRDRYIMLGVFLMTYVVYRCRRCNEVVYRWKKGETEPSRLLKGANIALHMITCDRQRFDAIIEEEFHGSNTLDADKSK